MNTCYRQLVQRQRANMDLNSWELRTMKEDRRITFSSWPQSQIPAGRMIEAGFYCCKTGDRVICLYCNLICQGWTPAIDDPCEVHRLLSPECFFVKSMSCYHSPRYNQITTRLPCHCTYLDPQIRLKSFSNWRESLLQPVEKLVEAGFFHINQKFTCFYCGGTLDSLQANQYHPIVEHTWKFPSCNYARQLCGEELFCRIQQLKYQNEDVAIYTPRKRRHSSGEIDLSMVDNMVAERLNWPDIQSLLQLNKFPRSIIEQCLKNQLLSGDGDCVEPRHLNIACEVLKKEIETTGGDETKILIPANVLHNVYAQRPTRLFNNNSEILASFDDVYETYKNTRKISSRHFTERIELGNEREILLDKWSLTSPSRRDMANAGWHLMENNITQCPHCRMQYSQWQADDDPRLIHQNLAPHCQFVLAENPFHSTPIPQETIGNVYTDAALNTADTQPYDGVVRTINDDFYSLITNRENSFQTLLTYRSIVKHELAQSGFYYHSDQRRIRCFYCTYAISTQYYNGSSSSLIKRLHLTSGCRYAHQYYDRDRTVSTQQSSSEICSWCSTNEKCMVALPCRHFCLCASCSQTKRFCPQCKEPVIAYTKIFICR